MQARVRGGAPADTERGRPWVIARARTRLIAGTGPFGPFVAGTQNGIFFGAGYFWAKHVAKFSNPDRRQKGRLVAGRHPAGPPGPENPRPTGRQRSLRAAAGAGAGRAGETIK